LPGSLSPFIRDSVLIFKVQSLNLDRFRGIVSIGLIFSGGRTDQRGGKGAFPNIWKLIAHTKKRARKSKEFVQYILKLEPVAMFNGYLFI
jgi:hypothetical protein